VGSIVGRDNDGNGRSRSRPGDCGITLHDMNSLVVVEALNFNASLCQLQSGQRFVLTEHISKRSCLPVPF
jgi:hypothetical protein